MANFRRKVLKRRGYCIHGCGTSVRERGAECRKCRRRRRINGLRIQAKARRDASKSQEQS